MMCKWESNKTLENTEINKSTILKDDITLLGICMETFNKLLRSQYTIRPGKPARAWECAKMSICKVQDSEMD